MYEKNNSKDKVKIIYPKSKMTSKYRRILRINVDDDKLVLYVAEVDSARMIEVIITNETPHSLLHNDDIDLSLLDAYRVIEYKLHDHHPAFKFPILPHIFIESKDARRKIFNIIDHVLLNNSIQPSRQTDHEADDFTSTETIKNIVGGQKNFEFEEL